MQESTGTEEHITEAVVDERSQIGTRRVPTRTGADPRPWVTSALARSQSPWVTSRGGLTSLVAVMYFIIGGESMFEKMLSQYSQFSQSSQSSQSSQFRQFSQFNWGVALPWKIKGGRTRTTTTWSDLVQIQRHIK